MMRGITNALTLGGAPNLGVRTVRMILALCGVACLTGGMQSASGGPVLTSARIERIQSTLSLSASPSVVIGKSKPRTSDELAAVIAATRLSNGNIAVADAGLYEIRVYDRTGQLVGKTGRRGEGPGDFWAVSRMWRGRGDSLLVWDYGNQRVSVITPQGRFARTWPRKSGYTIHVVRGVFEDGSLLIEKRLDSRSAPKSSIESYDMLLTRLAPESARMDTIGVFFGGEILTIVTDGRITGSSTIPLSRFGHVGVFGNAFFHGDGSQLRVTRISSTGDTLGLVALPRAAVALSADERSQLIEERLDDRRMPAGLRAVLQREFAAALQREVPAFDSLLTDRRGRLWLRETRHPTSAIVSWLVVTGEGQSVTRIQVPRRLGILEIGADYILASSTDDLGRAVVEEYALIGTQP